MRLFGRIRGLEAEVRQNCAAAGGLLEEPGVRSGRRAPAGPATDPLRTGEGLPANRHRPPCESVAISYYASS